MNNRFELLFSQVTNLLINQLLNIILFRRRISEVIPLIKSDIQVFKKARNIINVLFIYFKFIITDNFSQ